MKKYRYFTIFSDNDNCAFFESHNYEINISTENGDRLVDYQEIFYSKKLKDLIEELDINHLIKFQKVVFSDGIDREYYAIIELPVINCADVEKCGEVNYRINNGSLVKAVSNKDKEVVSSYLNELPEYLVAKANDEFFLDYSSPIKFTMSNANIISGRLKKYNSPLFIVAGDYSDIYCSDAFVKRCRKNNIKGLWFVGVACEETGGEPDGFMRVTPAHVTKKVSVPDQNELLITHFYEWLVFAAETAKLKKYKSVFFGMFLSDCGYRVYVAGTQRKSYGWEDDCEEPLSYFAERFDGNLSADEMLVLINESLIYNAEALKSFNVLFGFDDGDVYKPKKIK